MAYCVILNTDPHAEADFDVRFCGVATAARAWLVPKKIVGCWPPDKLLSRPRRRGP